MDPERRKPNPVDLEGEFTWDGRRCYPANPYWGPERRKADRRQANYFDKNGTLRNADGTRSIFDDVDE